MSYLRNNRYAAAVAGLLLAGLVGVAWAADSKEVWYDRAQIKVHTGTSDVDISAADLTSATALVTIAPATGTAMHDVKITIDLDKATTGFNDTHSDTAYTIQFFKGVKVDGTNYRPDAASASSAVSGQASNTRSVTLDLGTITADQGCVVYVLISTEDEDCELPYVVTYRAPKNATFTDVAN